MIRVATIIALLITLPMVMLAEGNDLKKLFNKYKNVAGFDLEIGEPDMDLDFDGDWSMGNFLNNVENFYILEFEKGKGNSDNLNKFKTKLEKLIDKKSFDTVIDINGDGSVRILNRKDADGNTTDYLIITEEDDEALFIWAGTN